jgi:hypothetical protein
VDARKGAVRAQIRFEQVRRYNLPMEFSSVGSVCDARVGRFCQWNEEDPKTPKEPDRIRNARANLLAALDSAAARSPADDWIAGQRIRYLVEAGRDTAAWRAAQTCAPRARRRCRVGQRVPARPRRNAGRRPVSLDGHVDSAR